jgi:uncharacterized protein (UPF0335 family)
MIDGDALRRYVSRAISLLEEIDAIGADLKEVYAEAKGAGFVTAQLRQVIKEQRMEPLEREAHLEAMNMLRHALGDLADMPLGKAAVDRQQGGVVSIKRPRGRPRKDPSQAAREDLVRDFNAYRPGE